MKITEANLDKAIRLANAKHWEDGLPTVRAQLRLAVNSLRAQTRNDIPQDASALLALIKQPKNKKIKRILQEQPIEAFAFALRDALL